jgi:predicted ester cyclase
MSTNANTATGRRFFEDLLGKANWSLADEILAPDIVMHHPSSPQPVAGAQNVVGFLGAFRAGFPNMSMKVEFAFGDGELVAVRWRMSGTHTAELFGIPPSGKPVSVAGISILRFSGGKVVEDWVSEDSLGLMQQIGVIPAMG